MIFENYLISFSDALPVYSSNIYDLISIIYIILTLFYLKELFIIYL